MAWRNMSNLALRKKKKTVDDNVIVNSRMHSSGSFFGKEKRNFQEFKVELNLFSSYAY